MRPNTVYISSLLKKKFPTAAKELISVLDKHNIIVKELTNTKDIWCRDYMPIQNRLGELVQFKYNPSYLKGKKEWEESRSDVHIVCETNGIKPIYSDINIDGGNIVLYNDKAILTDRIFIENPNYDKDKLIAELECLLKAKIIVIPAIKQTLRVMLMVWCALLTRIRFLETILTLNISTFETELTKSAKRTDFHI